MEESNEVPTVGPGPQAAPSMSTHPRTCPTPGPSEDIPQKSAMAFRKRPKRGPQSWLRKLRTPRKTPRKVLPNVLVSPSSTFPKVCYSTEARFVEDSVECTGPHTSTPKDDSFVSNFGGGTTPTPKRHVMRESVRRRLPFRGEKNLDTMTLSPFARKRSFRRSLRELDDEEESYPLLGDLSSGIPIAAGRRAKVENFEGPSNLRNDSLLGKNAVSLPEIGHVESDMTGSFPPARGGSTHVVTVADIETHREEEKQEEHSNLNEQAPIGLTEEQSKEEPVAFGEEPDEEGPVGAWLREVRTTTAGECLNALQAKLIAPKDKTLSAAIAVGNAQERAEKIWDSGNRVLDHLRLCRRILHQNNAVSPNTRWSAFCSQVDRFCNTLRIFLRKAPSVDNGKDNPKDEMDADCDYEKLRKRSVPSLMNRPGWREKTLHEIDCMEESFQQLLDRLVRPHIKVISDELEEASGFASVKRSIYAVILLGKMFGESMCQLLAEVNVVRSLLSLCIDVRWRPLHACALRALTVVCSSSESVKRLLDCDGVECVTEVLCDSEGIPAKDYEQIGGEAAGLVAQCAAPWTANSSPFLNHDKLETVGLRLVKSLTDLAAKSTSSEVFLLASAALANLSFRQEAANQWMMECETHEVLTNACRTRKDIAGSLFAMDQVSTILANCASHSEALKKMAASSSLLVGLLCFLQTRSCLGHSSSEAAACERLQQKSAIAIARLCSINPDTARNVADMQGIQRLVRLCKNRKERNNSDSVLVACLAALRKIAPALTGDELRRLGAMDLVNRTLWEAFIANSSKQESYV